LTRESLLSEAFEAIVNCDEVAAVDVAKRSLAEGVDPVDILADGFSAGIREIGERFGRGESFLPELILAASSMKSATDILSEAISASGAGQKQGVMVIATVEGDVHDIGKGIVVSILKTQGIEVIDIGRDVPTGKIIQAAIDHNVDIIGTCALLTTTMTQQKKLEDELKARGLKSRFKTMIGGAPCTKRWAAKIGADGYAEDAAEAVKLALQMLGRN
jgi:trimethylamine corrinoid protein